MKIKFFYLPTFILSCMFSAHSVQAQIDAGFYQFVQPASHVSEVTTSPHPEAPTARPAARSTSVTSASVTVPPAKNSPTAPAKDYSTRRTGDRAAGGEKLTRLESCGTLRMISGKKSRRANGRATCAPVTIAESFVTTLMSQLPICILEGTRAKGINKSIQSSNIYNAGSYGQRSGKKYSMHEAGRGFDIYQIDVTFTDGTTLNTPMTISSKKDAFYKGFNRCWERLTSEAMKDIDPRCRSYIGLLDCNDNRAHHDHVHVSLPYCPKKSGFRTY